MPLAFVSPFAEDSSLDRAWTGEGEWTPYGGGPSVRTTSGETVTPESAMSLSTYWTCVSGIAADIASPPACAVRRRKPMGRDILDDHAVTRFFDEGPNDEIDAFTFRETMTAWALTWGNAYAEIERDGLDRPLALWPIHPSRVVCKRDDFGVIGYWVRVDPRSGNLKRVDRSRIYHLHGLGDGVEGFSVLRFAAQSIGLALAAQTYGAAMFGNDCSIGTMVSPATGLGDTEFAAFHETLKAKNTGAKNAHGLVAFNQPVKVDRAGIPPEEAQFLETRTFQVEDVCRWFRRSPQKAGFTARAQGWSTLDALNQSDVDDCLMPWWIRWEKTTKRALLRDERGVSLKHYVQGRLRGDAKTRIEYYRARRADGSMTVNEERELEDENPLDTPNANEPTIQGATVLLKSLGATPAAPPPFARSEPPEPARAPPPADTQPEDDDDEDEPDYAALLRPVFLDAATRMVGVETNAFDRAMLKHGQDSAAIDKWGRDFYAKHRGLVGGAFRAAATVLGADAVARLDAFAAALWPDILARQGEIFRTTEIQRAESLCDAVLAAVVGVNRRAGS